MATIRLIFFTIATIFIAVSALASTTSSSTHSIAESFRSEAKVLPRRLIALGYTTIGDVNLADLIVQIDLVDIRIRSSLIHQQPDGFLRGSAEWYRSGSQSFIVIDGSRWAKKRTEALPNLALHEFFGALGFGFDEKYVCSSAFDLLANSQLRANLSGAELNDLLTATATRCSNLHLASGGSTGVAGGGDVGGIYLRKAIQKKYIKQLFSASSPQEHTSAFEALLGTFSTTVEAGPRLMPRTLHKQAQQIESTRDCGPKITDQDGFTDQICFDKQ